MASGSRKKQDTNLEYEKLREDLKKGTPGRLYAFYGEERYLLEDALRTLRGMIPQGTEEFNHHRLEGKGLSMNLLAEAVDSLPAFSEITLIEVWDLDLSKLAEGDRDALRGIITDIPDYATVVLVFDTVEYGFDARTSFGREMKKLISAVEFKPQGTAALSSWIVRHLASNDRRITRPAIERLITMTGGLMTNLLTEVEKLSAYTSDVVDVRDVEAVVVPVPDAAAWDLTDAITAGNNDLAMEKLAELFRMDIDTHRLMYYVTMKFRQLLTAKAVLESGGGVRELMDTANMKWEFQARALVGAARRMTMARCRRMCLMSVDTAFKLNSSRLDDREIMTDMAIRMLTA